MKFNKIQLTNFRAFKSLDLELHPQLNVIAGINGTGKTTILEACAMFMSNIISCFINKGKLNRKLTIDNNNIHGDSTHTKLDLNFIAKYEIMNMMLEKDIIIKKNKKELLSSTNYHNNSILHEMYIDNNYPLIAYYTNQRVVQNIKLENRPKDEYKKSPLDTYQDALDSRAVFNSFFEWFREQEDYENELIVKSIRENTFYDKSILENSLLNIVKKAIYYFMPDIENISIEREKMSMSAYKKGQKIYIEQFSDGEKCLLALIGDLARRLGIANPNMENPLHGTGVVLIDEIELHLHPTWQREVMNKLTETFPNIQFIMTTHSPQVISETRKENLFLLSWDNQQKQPVITKPSRSFGLDSTTVLNEIMDSPIYNKQVQQQINEIFQSIDDEQYEQAEKLIKELENDCDGEIPETVRAKTYLSFARVQYDFN